MTLRSGQIGTCSECGGHCLPAETCRRCGTVAPSHRPDEPPRLRARFPDATAGAPLTAEDIRRGRAYLREIRADLERINRRNRVQRSGLRSVA